MINIKYSMNITTLIVSIAALLTGVTAGTVFTNNTHKESSAASQKIETAEDVIANDFVSMRPSIAALPHEGLSDEEVADALFMREEEKLARDVYQVLYETWDMQIFSNIAQSEQTHTEAIRTILEKYNVADPVIDDTVGVFQNEDLQKLYTSLVETGKTSKVAALTVGATVEDLDIRDLQEAIARTDNSDIKLVYENLSRGSRNHLRAFTRQISAEGVSYSPQYITQGEYEAILNGVTETGGGNQNGGRGWGKHKGNQGAAGGR
jgi:hypothetical protein